MDTLFQCCAGLDVHKKTVTAHVRRIDDGNRLHVETREYGTMTGDLRRMAAWLAGWGVSHVVMESTGVYWKPVYNVLDTGRFEVWLVNARHVKQVPGRKTDVEDSEWLAKLLQHGLLRPSFVPTRRQRELRDLTRHRVHLVDEKTRIANRIHKTLEDANVKLGAVATDILGVSGRDMINAISAGNTDVDAMATMARGRLRAKIPQLREALQGEVREHHRFLLRALMDQLAFLERQIDELQSRIDRLLQPEESAIQRLGQVPGIDRVAAQSVLAEIGTQMDQFPSAAHLSSWAGLCSGNHESAGKRRSGRTTKGNRWLRRTLVQCAWAASHAKDSYLAAQYRRLASRRGKKRALVAVAHSILVIVYHMLRDHRDYIDLGADHFDRLRPDRLTRYFVHRLEQLGHRVTLETAA